MAGRILITPRSFAKVDKEPLNMLKAKGFKVVTNPYGRILTKQEMQALIQDVEGIIVGVDPLDQDVLQQASQLKVISKYGVGTDNIDLETARENNIIVTVTEDANTNAVAEYTVTLMLAVMRRIIEIDQKCRQSDWRKLTSFEMSGKTLGIIGLGNIGKRVIQLLCGYDLNLLAYDIDRDEAFAAKHNVSYVTFDTLLKESDFISLHAPLNERTHHMISHDQFAMMKENAIIVNTARGGLIDEQALLTVLKDNRIWGAGLDVFEEEPPQEKAFFNLSNLVIGSHCAASTYEAINNMSYMASSNILKYLKRG